MRHLCDNIKFKLYFYDAMKLIENSENESVKYNLLPLCNALKTWMIANLKKYFFFSI